MKVIPQRSINYWFLLLKKITDIHVKMFIFVHMGNFLSTKQFSKLVKFIICFIVSQEKLLAKKNGRAFDRLSTSRLKSASTPQIDIP